MEALQTLERTVPEEYGYIYFPEEDDLSKDGLAVSEEEYWAKYYQGDSGFVYEWKNGYLEVKPVSDVKGNKSCQWFQDILRCYLRTNPVGTAVVQDIGFRLAFPGSTSVRRPDLCVVLRSNPDILKDNDCTYQGIFDLCAECLSYSSKEAIIRDTVEKKREYAGTGVKEYYILDGRGIETAFYCPDKTGRRYKKIKPVGGDIIRSRVLPGFQFRISDLYRQPDLEELAEDPVYCGYVFPSYRQIKLEKEQEKQRAEKAESRIEEVEKELFSERQRAEQERQRAEMLAAKLRELGISPE
jgi:Uma2 family endonuclease